MEGSSVRTTKDIAAIVRIPSGLGAGVGIGNGKWVWVMRCHLMKDGQVRGVLLLDDKPYEGLIEQAEAILKEWTPWITSVEVCRGTSVIYRSSAPPPPLEMAAD